MTDYKLVPVEPTPEMLQVWKSMYGYSRYDKYKAMLAAAPAVQGEPGVKWAPEEAANGNKGIRWVSDEGVHGRPTDHDCRVYLESNPNARGCHCPECTKLYTAPQPAEEIGEVVVTKDKLGNIVSITRQDVEGRVLSVIAKSEGISQSVVLAEGYFHHLPLENDYEFHDVERFPGGNECPDCIPVVIVRKSELENASRDPQPAKQQTVLLDDDSPAYQVGEIGNQIHNLGCEYQNDEELADRLAEIAHQAWVLQRSVMISKQRPAPDVAGLVEALERCKFALLNTSASCQKGVCEVCYCRQCAYDAAHTALAAHRRGGES